MINNIKSIFGLLFHHSYRNVFFLQKLDPYKNVAFFFKLVKIN